MPAGTLNDIGAPAIEVRILRDERLLVSVLCESEEGAAAVVEQWSDVQDVHVLVGRLSTHRSPGGILARDELPMREDDSSIASATIPGCGIE